MSDIIIGCALQGAGQISNPDISVYTLANPTLSHAFNTHTHFDLLLMHAWGKEHDPSPSYYTNYTSPTTVQVVN